MKIEFSDYAVELDGSSGFPAKVTQYLRNGLASTVLHTEKPWLTIRLADGRRAVPRRRVHTAPRTFREEDGTIHVQFNNVPFLSEDGYVEDWRLNVDDTLCPDGNCFIALNYESLGQYHPAIAAFTLRIPLELGTKSDVTYGFWPRPEIVDPTGEKCRETCQWNLRDRKNREYGYTVPLFRFDFGETGRQCRRMEWFMEDQLSIRETADGVATRLLWEDGNPVMEYEFAAEGAPSKPYPFYWRNKIGFTLTQTGKIRKRAPMRIFFYADETERLPTIPQTEEMIGSGADAIVLGKGWRRDRQNGGFPADREKLRTCIRLCRNEDVRIAPYACGDEESAKENACDWFLYDFKKDYDGLYADFAGPLGFYEKNPEYAGGHVGFLFWYRHFGRIRRETVGENGLLLTDSGSFSASAVFAAMADAAGDASVGAGVCAGQAEKQDSAMLPVWANTGAMILVRFGEGRDVSYIRPLWRLYGLMKNEAQVRFDNDSCDAAFRCDGRQTGIAAFTMQDGAVLYLLSNFAEEERKCAADVTLCAADGKQALRLDVMGETATAEAVENGSSLTAVLPPRGICGFLVCPKNEKWAKRLERFREE